MELHMKIEDLHDGTILWIIKSVPIMSAIDTLLRAPQSATMRVLMHKIVDFKYIIWSIKSVHNMIVIDTLLQAPQGTASNMPSRMSHHLGMARTVIDSHHLMIVIDHYHLMVYIDIRHHMSFAATSHFMIAIDQHLPRIFDGTTQAMVMMYEDEILDIKTTNTIIWCLPLRGWKVHIAHTFRLRRLPPLVPPPQWPLARHMPMDSDATSASNKATLHGNVPISYVSTDMLHFDELQAQATKKPTAPTLQDEDLQGQRKDDVDPSIALHDTTAPPMEDDLGGDRVEMVEHGNFPSTKQAHGDEKVEPTPICLIDELVPIPCEHESHLAHLSESDSELSDFHPICEFECFRLEDMSDTPNELREVDDSYMKDIAFANTLTSPSFVSSYVALGSTEDEFPIMEKMYMVHEDDDISPCLLQDGHVDHMDPPTSTTPTSNESAYKGTRTTTATATEHELTKRAIESYPNKDLTRGNHIKGYVPTSLRPRVFPTCLVEFPVPTSTRTKREGTPMVQGREKKKKKKKERREEGRGRGGRKRPTGPRPANRAPGRPVLAGRPARRIHPDDNRHRTDAKPGNFANFPVGGRLTGPAPGCPVSRLKPG
ncbi:hypothetical protein QYE76_040840 [Lolium multiflorum]|uniref:Uncharacterized protein n=1 Tax=Lolium multiflorum TaxID=4521 RepID=A0AAD8TDP2_LOLMU|nr:hypothetical protein QYE76_040840 [Lolium multiflorum]